MNRRFVRRFVEAFFLRWPFYVSLFVLCLLMGATTIRENRRSFTSYGTLHVEARSLVGAQSGAGLDSYLYRLTPAGFVSQELSGLISTDTFMESLADRVGVELSDDEFEQAFQLDILRSGLWSEPGTENLISFGATTGDPENSRRIVQAVIDEFMQFEISIAVNQSMAAEEFFTEVSLSKGARLSEVRGRVDAFYSQLESLDGLPQAEAAELKALREEEAEAEAEFRLATERIESSRLVRRRAETDVRQRLTIVDRPVVPTNPDAVSLLAYLHLLAFTVAGVVLTSLGPLIAALRSRTVMFPEDVGDASDLPVLAIVSKLHRSDLDADLMDNSQTVLPRQSAEDAVETSPVSGAQH